MRRFVPMDEAMMDTPAWIALSVHAKALYPGIKRRAGVLGAKNGEFSYSVREAAAYLKCDKNTAAKALAELQSKGFIVAVVIGHLGMTGVGKATIWRLTEWALPGRSGPTNDFQKWSDGNDFPVAKGKRGKRSETRRSASS